MKRPKLLLTIALSAIVATTAPLAAAQADPDAGTAPSATDQASQYSDADVKAFASAAVAVQAIRDLYVVKIMAAGDEDQARQLREAAVTEMAGAVQQQGLSVERFQQILLDAQGDPALVDRINQQLNSR
ncbi:MAG TPA: DUF4168 domain-containing protein [Burkholderiales bacterium]|nr:DUF4168 domain-containing protein [Burkholderiales bacterium]